MNKNNKNFISGIIIGISFTAIIAFVVHLEVKQQELIGMCINNVPAAKQFVKECSKYEDRKHHCRLNAMWKVCKGKYHDN